MAYAVLISSDDPAAVARWSDWLCADPAFQIIPPKDPALAAAAVDVVLTDQPGTELAAIFDAVRVAVEPGQGDVVLPADCLSRELRLACRLAAELAQARRQLLTPKPSGQDDLSLLDELTGLPNRRAWQRELASRLALAAQRQSSLCLALFDLDHFKQVNAGWGHSAGDRLLAACANAIRARLRPGDYVARLGGDEFALLFSGLDRENAAAVVERVRAGVPVLAAREAPHVVGCSAGFSCTSPPDLLNAEALFNAADRALALAKKHGRDVTIGG
ncbi:MAG: GGDEF domain-containing protein [Pirellulales bacterium]